MHTLLTTSKLKITSNVITLRRIVEEDILFNIPIYQRLYVWGEQQIRTLLADLHRAFLKNKNENYYLGGVMLTENNNKHDLIDGQQRFTTLWLISKVLEGDLAKFNHSYVNKKLTSRISFSVRDFANQYFNLNERLTNLSENEIKELEPISKAIELIRNYVKDEVDRKEEFSSFIYNRVMLVATKMPKDTDENKVFEAMNNRGVQLQQHEILKSTLLANLKGNRILMHKYGLLWDACSIMDDYLEKNIKLVANLLWKDLFADTIEADSSIELPDDILKRLLISKNEKQDHFLLDILKEEINEDEIEVKANEAKIDEKDYDSGSVRSIIDFPMLLLHTLRIYQFRENKCLNSEESAEVKGKNLIQIFNKYSFYFQTDKDVMNFIDLLWNVRKQFDKFVIKWVSNDEEKDEVHVIKKLYQSETAFQRRAPKNNEGFALLQSMLYHSQQIITHYWLTPFLNKMLDTNDKMKLHQYLEALDNAMFCVPKKDLRKQSYDMMLLNDTSLNGNIDYVRHVLDSAMGTSYPSYWFYKTEYLLWKNRFDFYDALKWEDFKITAKNSVEHISPQKPSNEDYNLVYDKMDNEQIKRIKQDDFGNLVLLSPGMNSEYSNKPYNVKMIEFHNKRNMDSLKSDLIFIMDYWNWERCESHKKTIIKLFEKHIN